MKDPNAVDGNELDMKDALQRKTASSSGSMTKTDLRTIFDDDMFAAESALAEYYGTFPGERGSSVKGCCFDGAFRSPTLYCGDSSDASTTSSPSSRMFAAPFGSGDEQRLPATTTVSAMGASMEASQRQQRQQQRQKQHPPDHHCEERSKDRSTPEPLPQIQPADTNTIQTAQRKRTKKSSQSKTSKGASSALPSNQPLTEDFLVKELNDLSIQERQQVYEDVHGVSAIRNETPEFLRTCLDEMEREIARLLASTASSAGITKEDRQIYDKAMFYCPKLLRDAKLRLMFLRCEDYQALAAAVRYMRYWSFQYDIVDGDWDAILKPCGITQDDIFKRGDFMNRGFMHVLPTPDQSGRMVIAFFHRRFVYDHWRDTCRGYVYVLMRALEQNVDAQINGIVGIAYECIKDEQYMMHFDLELLRASAKLYTALPIKYQAFHFCYDDVKMNTVMSMIQLVIGRHGRIRIRSHLGTNTECQYKLMTFGIPTHALPVHEATSTINMEPYHAFLEACKQRQIQQLQEEGDQPNQPSVDYPTSQDVLHGRGRSYQEHPGNRRLNAIIAEHWDAYQSCERPQRIPFIQQIIDDMKRSGTRFLQKRKKKIAGSMESEWVVVDDSKAHDKVSHTFRNKPVVDKYHSSKHVDEEVS